MWVLSSTALVASHAALIDRALSVSPSFCSRRAKKSEKWTAARVHPPGLRMPWLQSRHFPLLANNWPYWTKITTFWYFLKNWVLSVFVWTKEDMGRRGNPWERTFFTWYMSSPPRKRVRSSAEDHTVSGHHRQSTQSVGMKSVGNVFLCDGGRSCCVVLWARDASAAQLVTTAVLLHS